MKNKLYKLMTIFLLSISLFSCKKTNPRYDSFSLDNCASWCIASEDETIEDAQNHTFQPLKLEYNEYFVLGDDRINSEDSRNSSVGLVKKEYIYGKAWYCVSSEHNKGFVK